MTEPHIAIRLDAEDRALLDECSRREKLTKSDILRRALRAYARMMGVEPESEKRKPVTRKR